MKIAINGFGRIGRQVLKILLEKYPAIEIVAINDLTDNETLAHLLKYDSNYGPFQDQISASEDSLNINGKEIIVLSEKDPANLPWNKLGVEIVIESTGFFTKGPLAKSHLDTGAKKVIITAPGEEVDRTIILGVNEDSYDQANDHIISMASCTTNCLAPMAKTILDNFGILKGFMSTIHSYTNDQRILDLPHEDLRRARAAALNIIPTKTGAAKAIGQVIPELEGKLDGFAFRVPTPTVSLTDLVVTTEQSVTVDDINNAFKQAESEKMKGILSTSKEPLVSMDYKGNPYSCIVDLGLTRVIDNNLIKIVGWYDNEWGYSNRVADLTDFILKKI